MRIVVQADHGDAVAICADLLGVEQAIITLEIENQLYTAISELETVTLTVDKARDLAAALLTVADDLELVRRAHPETVNKASGYVCERPQPTRTLQELS